MKWRDWSIARKLGLLLALSSAVAVLLVATVFSIGTTVGRYTEAQEQVAALAGMVGENSRAALAFNDPESARRTLQALHAKEEVAYAVLLDAHGNEFASVSFPQGDDKRYRALEWLVSRFSPGTFKVSQPILDGSSTMGRVELTVRVSAIWEELIRGLQLMLLVAIALSTLAVYFGMRLHHVVSGPILELARASHRVSSAQDYSIRARKTSNDEIGMLVNDFNHMLAEIQSRDEALRQERASLEDRVEQRTIDLKLAMEAAERANKVKSEFLSTVSHELRTPLTAIAGSIGLISGGALGKMPEPIQQMLHIAQKNSQRLTYLINDLLDMEKLMAGKLHFDLQVQDIMPLIESALVENQSYAQQHQVSYVLTQRVEGMTVDVDAQRLQQVLANLLSNAAKFSPEGAQVEVAVSYDGHRVRVDVIDHGDGIPLEFQDRIFQKFSQADASDTRQKGGTGLGLAITRELVERMGGRVGFESTPGQGTCFHFDLPAWSEEMSRPAFLAPEEPVHGGGRVLVVEDDLDVARLLGAMLTRGGYTVDYAPSGAEALEKLQLGDYAAVTLDLLLPDMNGVDVIRQARAHAFMKDLPFVVIATKVDQGFSDLGPDIARVEWLAKPIEQAQLLNAMVRCMPIRRARSNRVLHVEDDRDMHDVVRGMVNGHCDFELATSLREARARVALERFDVILLDLALPKESGWDLLTDIRTQQPQTRVVVLTGIDVSPEDARRVDAVVQKAGVTPGQLLTAMGDMAGAES
jgi:signal transduction histidine kinase/DNA-binding response OmpR family regulator